MPRKTKTSAKETEHQSAGTTVSDVNGTAGKPLRSTPVKGRKSSAKKAIKRAGSKKGSSNPTPAEPTDEEIRIRAYFIAERRHRLALAGNADSDWLEAKRQLLSEIGSRVARLD